METEIKVYFCKFPDRDNLVMMYRDPFTRRQVTKSAGTANQKAAEKAAAKWEDDLQNGRYKAPSRVTWEEFRDKYESEVLSGLAPNTEIKVSDLPPSNETTPGARIWYWSQAKEVASRQCCVLPSKSLPRCSESCTLLVSIHPRYVDQILAGSKTFELRKRLPRATADTLLIYCSSPRMELAAIAKVECVHKAPLNLLWQLVRQDAGVTRTEFRKYYRGFDEGVAIELSEVRPFDSTISLATLRQHWPGFQPPQCFRYLERCEWDWLVTALPNVA
jgi:predicted transcriptional regulator